MAHPVLWFDVMGKDGKSLGSFYSQLFGWEFKQEDTEGIAYGVLSLGEDGGVGGVVTTSPDDGNGFATFSVEVDDISATLAQVEELGGKTKMPAMEVPGKNLTFASFTDPEDRLLVESGERSWSQTILAEILRELIRRIFLPFRPAWCD